MKQLVLILCFAVFLPAMSSWGQGGVIVDGKEWLQPADFLDYTYAEVNALCSGKVCAGTLPGSEFNLTGYTWASIGDVSALFNAYGVSPPFTEPFQERVDDGQESAAIAEDFAITDTWCFGDCPVSFLVVAGMVRDPAPGGGLPYTPYFSTVDVSFGLYSNNTGLLDPDDGIGVWFYRQVADAPPIPEEDIIVSLEEPIDGDTHSGIGNLRGWAVAEDGIDRVEIDIDGEYAFEAPFGGERTDVAEAYPDIDGSGESGFSLAFGYSNLGVGEHTVTARAFTRLGEYREDTSTFNVEAFEENFISSWEVVDISQSSISSEEDNQIYLEKIWAGGAAYNLTLRWRSAEQGFEIVDIERPLPPPGSEPVTYFGMGEGEDSSYTVCLNLSADATQLEASQSQCPGGSSFYYHSETLTVDPDPCELDYMVADAIPIVDQEFIVDRDGVDPDRVEGRWQSTTIVTGFDDCGVLWSASSEVQ